MRESIEKNEIVGRLNKKKSIVNIEVIHHLNVSP